MTRRRPFMYKEGVLSLKYDNIVCQMNISIDEINTMDGIIEKRITYRRLGNGCNTKTTEYFRPNGTILGTHTKRRDIENNVVEYVHITYVENGQMHRRITYTYIDELEQNVISCEKFTDNNQLISLESSIYDKHDNHLENTRVFYNDGRVIAKWFVEYTNGTFKRTAYYPNGHLKAQEVGLGDSKVRTKWNQDGTIKSERIISCSCSCSSSSASSISPS